MSVNHMSHSRTGDASTGYRYNIAPIQSNYQVHYALASPWARDPEYTRGIIRSYVENKRLRGKTSREVAVKLNLLEKELPSFLQQFCDIREQYSLPPSPWVRNPANPTAPSGPNRRVSSATTSRYNIANPSMSYFEGYPGTASLGSSSGSRINPLTRTTTAPGRQQSGDRRSSRLSGNLGAGIGAAAGDGGVNDANLPAEFRVRRQNTEDRDEPPPPPYARQDPEPDSTRLLAERLAAESGAGAQLTEDHRPVGEADEEGDNASARQQGPSPSMASGNGNGNGNATPTANSPRPSARHSSFSHRSSSQQGPPTPHRPSPPRMPGSYDPPTSPPPRASSHTSASHSERPNLARSDSEQLRMAYEESQLEEAKRESMAAEREREEMERAIQMSLEAEEAEALRASQAEGSSGRTGAGGASRSGGSGGSGAGPSQGGSVYGQSQQQRHYQQQAGINGEYNQVPSHFDPSADSPQGAGQVNDLSTRMQETSLLDEPDESQFLAIPPMHTGTSGSSTSGMISPRLQSKNPFLSPHDAAKPLPRPPSRDFASHNQGGMSQNGPPAVNGGKGFSQAGMMQGSQGSQYPPQLPPASPGYQAVQPVQHAPQQGGSQGQRQQAVVIVDDGAEVTGFVQARQIVQGLITEAKLDVYFVNSKRVGKDIETLEDVQDLFGGLAPRGSASIGARLDYLLHEQNIIVITDGVCARPIARRAKLLRVNPALTAEQLLSGEPADDLEKVLETRVGRVHFVQVGDDAEGRQGLESLAAKGMSMGVYTSLSEEFIQATLSS